MKKVIIAGSRTFSDYALLEKYLDSLIEHPVIIVSGCAKGADSLGELYAKNKGYLIEKHPANWSNITVSNCIIKRNGYGIYNALAGYNRNIEMLESIKNCVDGGFVVAFWDGKSKGTKDMIDIAKKNGIDVFICKI